LAIKTGQRPTATILRDRYAGYRDWDDVLWENERAPYVDSDKWTSWDYVLASVAQLIEDYTDKNNGQLFWVDASDKVDWEVRSTFSGYDAAIKAEEETHDFQPGETLYAVPVINEDDPPTFQEWLEKLDSDTLHPPGYKNSGHNEWEILDAREEADRKRQEILDKLKKSKL
jgi:hypothetical protein